MATMLGSLLVSLGLESGEFKSGLEAAEKQLRASQKRIEKMGQNMANLGTKLSLGVTAPLVALGKKAVDGFIEQEKAIADVNAALKSMGNASGKTSAELVKTADALEMRSLFDAEVILKEVTAQLLTFGNVAGREFDRAQQAAVDMATRLGTEPQSAAITLGKALNDPIKGITALTRVGVQFTEQQKAQIEAMTEAGNVAGAQGIILAEVERQFAGAAQAAANTSPWRKAQVAIGQAMDKIGEAIIPIIQPVAEAIATIAKAFGSLPEPMQKVIIVAGILAAALGPVLIIVGSLVSAFAPLLGMLTAGAYGFGALLGAVLPVAAAVGAAYLVWRNWDDIAPRLMPIVDQLRAIGEGLGLVQTDSSKTSAELAKDDSWRNFGATLKNTSGFLQKLADDFDAYNQRTAAAARENGTTIQAGFAQIRDAFTSWVNTMNAGAARIAASLSNLASNAVASVQRMVAGIRAAVVDRLNAVWQSALNKIETVRAAFFNLWDKVTRRSYVPDMVDDIAREMGRLDTVMVAPATKAARAVTQAMRDMASETRALLARLFPEVEKLLGYRNDLKLLDGANISDEQRATARGRLAREVTGTEGEVPLSQEVMGQGPLVDIDLDEVNRALGAIAGTTDKVKKGWMSLKEVGANAFHELSYQLKGVLLGAQSLGDAIKNLIASLADMALSMAFKALGTSLGIPMFAKGTNFAPGGMAIVGERGPELVNLPRGSQVIPNHELAGMGKGGGQPITFNLYGVNGERQGREAASQIAMRMRHSLNAG